MIVVRVDLVNEPPVSGGRALFRVAYEAVLVRLPDLVLETATRKFRRVHTVRVIGLLPAEAPAESLQHDSLLVLARSSHRNYS